MPPAISDDEGSTSSPPAEKLPTRGKRAISHKDADFREDEPQTNGAENGADHDDDNDEEEESEELGEGEYIVEKVTGHMVEKDGTIKYKVKWEGYEKEEDMTWEPEENLLENAGELLEAYLSQIGGQEAIYEELEKAKKTKKRGRASGAGGTNKRSKKDDGSESPAPRTMTEKTWQPPAGSWEDHIASVDVVQNEENGSLLVYLVWNNGKKTKHDTSIVYKRCPQKMLQFYERHIRIIPPQSASGDEASK